MLRSSGSVPSAIADPTDSTRVAKVTAAKIRVMGPLNREGVPRLTLGGKTGGILREPGRPRVIRLRTGRPGRQSVDFRMWLVVDAPAAPSLPGLFFAPGGDGTVKAGSR